MQVQAIIELYATLETLRVVWISVPDGQSLASQCDYFLEKSIDIHFAGADKVGNHASMMCIPWQGVIV
jgi:hypothetical protein